MLAKHHIVSSTQSKVIIGPIQDNILGLWLISKNRTKVCTKSTFLYILGSSIHFDIGSLSNIEERNGGKFYYGDLYECIFPNNLSFNNNSVNIMNGRLLSGLLDKSNLYTILKVIFHNYDPDATKNIISALQRVSDTYLMFRGHSIGIQDCTIDKETKKRINDIIIDSQKENYELLDKYDRGMIDIPLSLTPAEDYEIRALNIVGDCNKKTRTIINEYFNIHDNALVTIVESKAKGNWENIYQLLTYVGQKTVDGTRIPTSLDNRSYVNYGKGESSLVSRGFIINSFSDTLSTEQFFTEGVQTRANLIEKVLGVSVSGYTNKRLNKVMESMVVEYDGTIRMNGQIISNSFGGFGWDLIYLTDNNLTLINNTLDTLLDEYL
jgi:DNA-directed RNA polymerase II subunit RPB1